MNRDELHTRGLARAPRHMDHEGVRFIAPIDSDGGGTWVLVNECGLTVGLLNRYPSGYSPDPSITYRSRGQLVLSLSRFTDSAELRDALFSASLAEYRPFTLFAIDFECARVFAWNGSDHPVELAPELPLSSSSYRCDEVVGERVACFRQVFGEDGRTTTPASPGLSVESLRAYHATRDESRGAHSVCMIRPDAATKSFSVVTVDDENARFHYHAGAPCEDAEESDLALALQKKTED